MNTITRRVGGQGGSKRRLYAGFAGLLLLGICAPAYSICEPTIVVVATQAATTGEQTITGPLAAGVRIGSFTATSAYDTVFRTACSGTQYASSWARARQPAVSTWNGYSVYPTGVPGIGYAIDVADFKNTYFKLTGNPTGSGIRLFNAAFFGTLGIKSTVYFVTTAPLTGGVYNIPSQVIALTRSRNFNATTIDGAPLASSNLQLTGFRLTVRNTTCDLAAGDVSRTIILDPVKRSDFIDVAAGKKSFEITANCSDTSRVTFSFTGAPAPGDSWRFANTGTATGIGLWFYSLIGGVNQTITPNTGSYQRTVNVVNGKAVLPVGMGYFKTTGQPVTSGTLVSTVTVNITYQ